MTTEIKAGTKAPRFSLASDSGNEVSLGDFAGKSLVLYFYPKDDTPGCTREAIAFTRALASFAKAGASVVGVSKDSVESHCKFRDKYALKIPLLSDPDLSVHKAYGAFGEKLMYGKKVTGVIRSTFVIGPDGKVTQAFRNVKVDGHEVKVLEALGGNSSEKKTTKAKAAPKKAAPKKPAPKSAPAKAKAAPKKAKKR